MSWIISIDAGTTGVRAFAVKETGEPGPIAYQEFTQYFPRPGWVEHDAMEIWQTTQSVLAEVTDRCDEPIGALGITNQRETTVAWDARTSIPLHNAIVWQDRRTAPRCEELAAMGHLDSIRHTTGLVLDPYFSGSKMEWLLGTGGVRADEHLRLGTIDSWILWKLTGGAVHRTDASNASRTMLYDIRTQAWSEELCDLFGVPIKSLPQVLPSAGPFGVTAADSGCGSGIPITGVAGDQQSSLFGQACISPGMAKNTYGTGSFVLMNVGETCPDPVEGLLTTIAWQLGGSLLGEDADVVTHYALEGAIFSTGSAVQWLRDGLELIDDASECGPLAESVPHSDGVALVPAFNGLGSPWWDPRARGTILGITRGTSRGHLARAVLDSMVFQTKDVVDSMSSATGVAISELRVDGGASVMNLMLQLQADQLNTSVARSAVSETTALGAAYLAGLGAGIWGSAQEVSSAWTAERTFSPAEDRDEAQAAHSTWLRAVERSRGWSPQ